LQGDEADEAERLAAGVDKAVVLVGGDKYHAADAYGGFSLGAPSPAVMTSRLKTPGSSSLGRVSA